MVGLTLDERIVGKKWAREHKEELKQEVLDMYNAHEGRFAAADISMELRKNKIVVSDSTIRNILRENIPKEKREADRKRWKPIKLSEAMSTEDNVRIARENLIERNKQYWLSLDEKERKEISDRMSKLHKERWEKLSKREKDEIREKMSKSQKKRWINPKKNPSDILKLYKKLSKKGLNEKMAKDLTFEAVKIKYNRIKGLTGKPIPTADELIKQHEAKQHQKGVLKTMRKRSGRKR